MYDDGGPLKFCGFEYDDELVGCDVAGGVGKEYGPRPIHEFASERVSQVQSLLTIRPPSVVVAAAQSSVQYKPRSISIIPIQVVAVRVEIVWI